ncbi:MAG TPA: hypothetical protein VL087_10235 [Nitrospirota bacterium]|nr:hypothetical protein [Nitrospirota bacterium]
MYKLHYKPQHNRLSHFFVAALFLLGIMISAAFPALVFAEDLEMINRPVNTAGLTGLLFTTMPFTLPTGTVEIGVAVMSENSTIPKYTITELPILTITTGIARDMEVALKASYFQTTDISGNKNRGAGNTELSYKWNFWPQKEYSSVPAVALITTFIAPTGDKDIVQNEVNKWGLRFGLAAGSEIDWGAHVLGVYADGQIMAHDLSDDQHKDIYGIVNAGMLFPISKYRNLQMFVEYTMVSGKNKMTEEDGDYSALTWGLRLVSERFNLSLGTQFLHKMLTGYENSNRLVGMISFKF